MVLIKNNLKSLKKIKRNTLQNKFYKLKLKRFIRKFTYFYKKYLVELNFFYFMLIKKFFNLIFCFLDKHKKFHIFSKKKVARKKAYFHKKLNLLN